MLLRIDDTDAERTVAGRRGGDHRRPRVARDRLGRGAGPPELARRAARRGRERRRAHVDPRRRALPGRARGAAVRDRPRRRPADLPLGERRGRSRLRHHPRHPRRRPPRQRGPARRRRSGRSAPSRRSSSTTRSIARRRRASSRSARATHRSPTCAPPGIRRRRSSTCSDCVASSGPGEVLDMDGLVARFDPDRIARGDVQPRPGPPAVALGAAPGRGCGNAELVAAVLPFCTPGTPPAAVEAMAPALRGAHTLVEAAELVACVLDAPAEPLDAARAGRAPPRAPRAARRGAGPRARRRAAPARDPAQAGAARADGPDDRARALGRPRRAAARRGCAEGGVRLRDTLTGELRELEPAADGTIGVYVCGPTVYGRIHVGNARPVRRVPPDEALPGVARTARSAGREHHRHQRQDLRRRPGARRRAPTISPLRWRAPSSTTPTGSGSGGPTRSRWRPRRSPRSWP